MQNYFSPPIRVFAHRRHLQQRPPMWTISVSCSSALVGGTAFQGLVKILKYHYCMHFTVFTETLTIAVSIIQYNTQLCIIILYFCCNKPWVASANRSAVATSPTMRRRILSASPNIQSRSFCNQLHPDHNQASSPAILTTMASRQLCAFSCSDLGDGMFSCKKCTKTRKQTPNTGYRTYSAISQPATPASKESSSTFSWLGRHPSTRSASWTSQR